MGKASRTKQDSDRRARIAAQREAQRRAEQRKRIYLAGGSILVVAIVVVALVRGERMPLHVSASSWLALGYLCIFGSLVAFTGYAWLLRNARPVVATSYAYVNPIVAVFFGWTFASEIVTAGLRCAPLIPPAT